MGKPSFFALAQSRLKKIIKATRFDGADYLYWLAWLVFATGVILFLWFAIQYVASYVTRKHEVPVMPPSTSALQPSACTYRRILDGVCVGSSDDMNPRLVAIMIENSKDAWPLSGLAQASVVYEAPTESDIPRFMAIYTADTDVDQVGPVRSSRPYYLDWLEEYGTPIYMHVGGSDQALAQIETQNIFDMNEMHRGWYFWRSDTRAAPHSTYTSSRLWSKAIEQYGSTMATSTFIPWHFSTSSYTCEHDCISQIVTALSSAPAYQVVWQYNTSTNNYLRLQGGKQQTDEDGTAIIADTIIIQRVRAQVIDEIGRKRIGTIGKGETIIFHSGRMFHGHWEKANRKSPTDWLDDANNPIEFKPGKIWIEIVPQYGMAKWQ